MQFPLILPNFTGERVVKKPYQSTKCQTNKPTMEIRKIPIEHISPSPMNPRKTFDEGELRELADNIGKQGLLQPITIRPVKGETPYEIVCGERRYRAFRILSESSDRFGEILAIVREMTDAEAFDAMITENLQRKDVDPMEEAFAFGQLQKNGSSVQEIALRFGKSTRFVYDRIRLNSLIPELMKAVREGELPISAAMIVCKVNDEQQQRYYKQFHESYNGFTAANANGFVRGLFLKIEDAVWKDTPDFSGGCGRTCGECEYNTANHGCLFYEMKNTDGRCTDAERYAAKSIAFIEQYLASLGDKLVKAGRPLEKGKMVISIPLLSEGANDKMPVIKRAVLDKVKALGYEITDTAQTFEHRCWYDFDDERTQALLQSGECYRVLQIGDYYNLDLKWLAYYVKSDDDSVNVDGDGVPMKVQNLLSAYKREQILLPSSRVVAGCKALSKHGRIAGLGEFGKEELVLACSLMMYGDDDLCVEFGLGKYPKHSEIIDYVSGHLDKAAYILRSWLKSALGFGMASRTLDEIRKFAEPLIDNLGDAWCPKEYSDALQEVDAKFAKTEKKLVKQLKELGYGLDGKPLTQPDVMEKQFTELKKKHPEAILLFRVGDFYECFNEDAVKCSEILGITLSERNGKKLAGFPHHALDTYLPKLTRAGRRVAICEQLEDPKE